MMVAFARVFSLLRFQLAAAAAIPECGPVETRQTNARARAETSERTTLQLPVDDSMLSAPGVYPVPAS